VGNQCISCTCR